MTKMIKMSLVAAVAVAGLTTTSSAAKLEDAIKNTTIGGFVRYRVGEKAVEKTVGTNAATNTNAQTEQVKIVVKMKSKVNDKVTSLVQVVNVQNQKDSVAVDAAKVQMANFTYANNGTTVIAGLQALATPWTDVGDGARANGVLALKNLGAVTVAGGYFREFGKSSKFAL
jgi:hypothetical protein